MVLPPLGDANYLTEIIRIMPEIDEVINQHGGWPARDLRWHEATDSAAMGRLENATCASWKNAI